MDANLNVKTALAVWDFLHNQGIQALTLRYSGLDTKVIGSVALRASVRTHLLA